jgi:hypothetical protein
MPPPAPRPRGALRHAALVGLGFTAFYTLFFAPALFTGRLLGSVEDACFYHYPAVFGGRALWDPLVMAGYPRFADPQAMLWYPLALPLSLTGWEWLWNPFLLAPYVLGSCFTYGLVWRNTRSALAGAVAGLGFGLSGFLIAHMSHVAVVHAAAWLPLILWALDELRLRVSRRWFAALVGAVACCFLAGHVQIFVIGLALCGLYAAVHLPGAPVGWWRFGLASAGGVALGVGLCGVQLLPTFELIPRSQRARLSFAEFSSFSFPKRQLPQLVFPYVYGRSNLSAVGWLGGEPVPRNEPAVPYFGAWNFHEMTGFCGLLPCVLAGAGLLGGLRTRTAWFWALAAAAGLLLALGDLTPAAGWLYRVPLVRQFRCPCRFFLWLNLAVAVLAGLGAHALQSLPRLRGSLVLLLMSLVVAAGVGLAWRHVGRQMASADLFRELPSSVPAAVRSPLPWENAALGLPLCGLLLGLALLWAWCAWPGRLTRAALLAAVALDLGLFAWFAPWRAGITPAGTLARAPEPVRALARELRHRRERVLSVEPMIPATRGTCLDALPGNVSSLWGVPGALGYTPLGLERYARLLPGAWPLHGGKVDELLALRYLVSPVRVRSAHGLEWEEVPLHTPPLGRRPGTEPEVAFEVPSVAATRIGLVTGMGCAVELRDGEPGAELTVLTPSGALPPISLRAGEHLVEHCWERADVRPVVGHRLPPLTESGPVRDEAGRKFRVHSAVSFLPLSGRVTVTGLRFRWLGPSGPELRPLFLTLADELTGRAHPVHHLSRTGGRWRQRGALPDGSHLLLENRGPLRRAWLVSRVVRLEAEKMAATILNDAKLPDGSTFEPYRTALVEGPVPFRGGELGPEARAVVERHGPARVRVRTRAAAEAFLVLGDVDYPGWRATVDGRRTPVYRTDYVLRGVVVPAGEHVVELVFRPVSLSRGLALSGAAALVLLTGLLWRRRPRPTTSLRAP